MFDRHACHKQVVPPLVWPERHHRLHRYGTDNIPMTIYYAIVEGDPLDNGHDGHVLEGSDYSHIDDDSGRSRRQTYLGQLAWCGVCNASGPILAGTRWHDCWDTEHCHVSVFGYAVIHAFIGAASLMWAIVGLKTRTGKDL
jgi:hypothetical protein